MTGYIRLLESHLAFERLSAAVVSLHREEGSEPTEHVDIPALQYLNEVKFNQFDAFSYIGGLSHLTYAATILDTFLSDTTLFLFLSHPKSIGPKQSLTLETILECSTTFEAVRAAATKRVREISYLPFMGRIAFLEKNYGIAVVLDERIVSSLEHFSNLRNIAIHDQGFIDINYDGAGEVVGEVKACPRHPTPIGSDQLMKVFFSFGRAGGAVAQAVASHVLHAPPNHSLYSMIGTIGDGISSARAELEDPQPEADSSESS